MKKPKTPKDDYNRFIQYSSLAFEMMVIMALGVFAGIKIDAWLNLNFPVFTLILMILSVIGAIFHAIKNFIKKK
ncbi:AtpZ/AtpI family protein [Mangrovibacterium marinum]|uniref:Putative F0F1-ATPase subunit (Ca2+/Mg2+ transporter) n=1 Tax=Mangrovibacterium marinum TaxID=1639118 RepID=A0A2T5C6D5_9BACT|nr:AtpZ/AtpI family protein [Mangrovibacterium marinum]PTN10511.1 putative F0F1-ATPase subunit (Ca2+/Mg2+ transporter) [Mangrovibacterium marinum]